MQNIRLAAAAMPLLLLPAITNAQMLQERNIPLPAAQAIAQGAVEACAAKGFNVASVVVDRAGVTRVLLRADRAGPHTGESARAKAYTSASLRNATAAVAEAVEKNPAQRNLGQIPGFLLLGGGLPVRVGDEVVGAVGVGGAPTGQLDEECARAGIAKAQTDLR
jgi:uncharacterized protein GlcG (DUF336 family)